MRELERPAPARAPAGLAELETEAAPMKGAEAQPAVTSEMAVPTDATDPEGVSVSLAEAADDVAATTVQKFKLHLAAEEGHVDVVRALLEGKADPNLAMVRAGPAPTLPLASTACARTGVGSEGAVQPRTEGGQCGGLAHGRVSRHWPGTSRRGAASGRARGR